MRNLLYLLILFVAVSCGQEEKGKEAGKDRNPSANETEETFKDPTEKVLDISDIPAVTDGDIVFQEGTEPQDKALKIATGSRYTHVGLVYIGAKGRPYVIEAVQPVQTIKFREWVKRGKDHHVVIKRPKFELSEDALKKMKAVGKSFLEKNYDAHFEWSDQRLYCSELVWKIFERGAGVKLCDLKTLEDYQLDDPVVQDMLAKRYGSNIPYEQTMVAPVDLFNSEKLNTLYSN